MTAKPRRATYRHGNLKAEALKAAFALVAKAGHEALSLRGVADAVGVAHRSLYNHFEDREALLDAVATEAYTRLAAGLTKAQTPADYTAAYVRFALKNRAIYALMTSRPHATMKLNPPLQAAVHKVITEAMRIFCSDIVSPPGAPPRRHEGLHHAVWRHLALRRRRPRPAQREGADRGTVGHERGDVNGVGLDSDHGEPQFVETSPVRFASCCDASFSVSLS